MLTDGEKGGGEILILAQLPVAEMRGEARAALAARATRPDDGPRRPDAARAAAASADPAWPPPRAPWRAAHRQGEQLQRRRRRARGGVLRVLIWCPSGWSSLRFTLGKPPSRRRMRGVRLRRLQRRAGSACRATCIGIALPSLFFVLRCPRHAPPRSTTPHHTSHPYHVPPPRESAAATAVERAPRCTSRHLLARTLDLLGRADDDPPPPSPRRRPGACR